MVVTYFEIQSQNLSGCTEKNHEKFSYNNRSPGRDSNTGPPDYEVVELTSTPRRLVIYKITDNATCPSGDDWEDTCAAEVNIDLFYHNTWINKRQPRSRRMWDVANILWWKCFRHIRVNFLQL